MTTEQVSDVNMGVCTTLRACTYSFSLHQSKKTPELGNHEIDKQGLATKREKND